MGYDNWFMEILEFICMMNAHMRFPPPTVPFVTSTYENNIYMTCTVVHLVFGTPLNCWIKAYIQRA